MLNIFSLSRILLLDLCLNFGWRVPCLILLIVLASLMEGLTLSLLLPLLSSLGMIDSGLSQMEFFDNIFAKFGLEITLLDVTKLICFLIIFQYSFILLQNWTSASVQSRYLRKLRQETFERTLHAKWAYLLTRSTGDLITFITVESSRAASAVYVVVQLISALVTTGIFVVIAVSISWKLSVLLLAGAGLVAMFLYPIMRWARKLGEETSVQVSRSLSWLNEVINGAKLIKATASEKHVLKYNDEIEGKLEQIQRGMLFQPHLLRVIFEAAGILLLLGTLVLATQMLELQGGLVIAIVAIFMRLYPRIGNLQHLIQQLFMTLPAVENLRKFNAELDEFEEKIGNLENILPLGTLEASALRLRYGNKEVLKSINVQFPAGGYYALVGPSGAGKTSLVDCLLGLTNADKGKILFNGKSITQIGLTNWRHSVGYVTQETVLFNMSVAENIAWSNLGATQEEIEAAACRANAHDFILELENGYETIIGDRGVKLSGGQRQRLGLARALLSDRSVVILDEATSALDSESERIIIDAIRALHGEVTVIAIAHNLSTVRHCDKIFLMDNGEIVDAGSWEYLKKSEGIFAKLLHAQNLSE